MSNTDSRSAYSKQNDSFKGYTWETDKAIGAGFEEWVQIQWILLVTCPYNCISRHTRIDGFEGERPRVVGCRDYR